VSVNVLDELMEFDNLTAALEEAQYEAELNGVRWAVCVQNDKLVTIRNTYARIIGLKVLEVIRPGRYFSSGRGKWFNIKKREYNLEKHYRKNPLCGVIKNSDCTKSLLS